jgi:hypothetical protein
MFSSAIRLLPAEEFFWLTNPYVELAIIIVVANVEGPVSRRSISVFEGTSGHWLEARQVWLF